MSNRAEAASDGFTLIELLIVVLVLSVLSGIAIFAVSGTREHAVTACTSANERTDRTLDGAVAVTGGPRPEIVAGGDCS